MPFFCCQFILIIVTYQCCICHFILNGGLTQQFDHFSLRQICFKSLVDHLSISKNLSFQFWKKPRKFNPATMYTKMAIKHLTVIQQSSSFSFTIYTSSPPGLQDEISCLLTSMGKCNFCYICLLMH